jgi:hypothetical protein
MSFFGAIMSKIFPPSTPAAPAADAAPATVEGATDAVAADVHSTDTVAAAPAEPVDVEAVLTAMAEAKGDHGNWHESIVDLLKLLDLDSSLAARKGLADELNIHVGEAGTAEENMALLKGVMDQLAANGGKVPASMRS